MTERNAPMTFKEFKAWLEGFEESFVFDGEDQYPNSFQYKKIKQKLHLVEQDLVPKKLFRTAEELVYPSIYEPNQTGVRQPDQPYTIT
jgi:hypothetical protein